MVHCASENKEAIDQSKFWENGELHWETHRIGWAVAGACACASTIITLISVWQHCRNYTNRNEQRQVLRILYMPMVYAIISFFSYRFFRVYTYYQFIQIAYEAITLSAFLLLIIEYVASTAAGHDTNNALSRKDKRPLPLPFCCWRFRPTKAYFMYTVKWSVLQYVIIRPLASIAGIICEKLGVLCHAAGYNFRYASIYIEIVVFVSISISLYGLFLFYELTKEELANRRPLAKFLCIKLIVMFTFYQTFMFGLLKGRVIHETAFWTESNIANGLNALAICIEMVIFSALMMWAYPAKEYARKPGTPPTTIWGPLWDSINYADFALEIICSFKFFINYMHGKPDTHGHGHRTDWGTDERRADFGQAFGVSTSQYTKTGAESPILHHHRPNSSYDDTIRLSAYTYERSSGGGGARA